MNNHHNQKSGPNSIRNNNKELKTNLQTIQSSPNNVLKIHTNLNNAATTEFRNLSTSLSLSSTHLANPKKVNLISPITSPTYHNGSLGNSMNFNSTKDVLTSPVRERITSTSLNNIPGLSFGFNPQRNSTISFFKSREGSVGTRESYCSDTADFKRFNPEKFTLSKLFPIFDSIYHI